MAVESKSKLKEGYEKATAIATRSTKALSSMRKNSRTGRAAIDTVEAGVGGAIGGAMHGMGLDIEVSAGDDEGNGRIAIPAAAPLGILGVVAGVAMKQDDAIEVGKGAFAFGVGRLVEDLTGGVADMFASDEP